MFAQIFKDSEVVVLCLIMSYLAVRCFVFFCVNFKTTWIPLMGSTNQFLNSFHSSLMIRQVFLIVGLAFKETVSVRVEQQSEIDFLD